MAKKVFKINLKNSLVQKKGLEYFEVLLSFIFGFGDINRRILKK